MSHADWERGYDVGYYEALRNGINVLITLLLNGVSPQEAVKQLVELRDNAHANITEEED